MRRRRAQDRRSLVPLLSKIGEKRLEPPQEGTVTANKYRLVTRSDFDGLVCGVLLKELNLIDDISFVHPKDMQDGKVAISARDITTNLPYVPGCHLAFDHHSSELERTGGRSPANHIIDADAMSAARVVYRYFGGQPNFPRVGEDIMCAVDKADSARFAADEILRPDGWALLNFLMDSRTGLGRFRQFRISNYELMMKLIDYCRDHTVEQILSLPDVAERVASTSSGAPRPSRRRGWRWRRAPPPPASGGPLFFSLFSQRGNHLRRQSLHDL